MKPDDVRVLSNLGVAYSAAGRYPEAVGAFKQAARIETRLRRGLGKG